MQAQFQSIILINYAGRTDPCQFSMHNNNRRPRIKAEKAAFRYSVGIRVDEV
jgi:hypothetical protein